MHGKVLAAANDTHTRRAGVNHLYITALGEFTGGVAHPVGNALGALVSHPSIHEDCVIGTVNENFLNSRFLKYVLLFQVPMNLS